MGPEEMGKQIVGAIMDRVARDFAPIRAQIAALADDNRALRHDLVALEAKMFGRKKEGE